MPGSANFVGEFLILLGVFKAKIVFSIIAFPGVVMASVYALRLFIRAMHNRVGPRSTSREMSVRDGVVLVPLVAGDPRASRSIRRSRCTKGEAVGGPRRARPAQQAASAPPSGAEATP